MPNFFAFLRPRKLYNSLLKSIFIIILVYAQKIIFRLKRERKKNDFKLERK